MALPTISADDGNRIVVRQIVTCAEAYVVPVTAVSGIRCCALAITVMENWSARLGTNPGTAHRRSISPLVRRWKPVSCRRVQAVGNVLLELEPDAHAMSCIVSRARPQLSPMLGHTCVNGIRADAGEQLSGQPSAITVANGLEPQPRQA